MQQKIIFNPNVTAGNKSRPEPNKSVAEMKKHQSKERDLISHLKSTKKWKKLKTQNQLY